jgi:hypothetical protein
MPSFCKLIGRSAAGDLLFRFTSHIANSQGRGYLKLCHPESL